MKKIPLVLATVLWAGTPAFADMSATLYMTGSLTDNKNNGFTMDDRTQQYNNMLQFSYSGKNAGAQFDAEAWSLGSNPAIKLGGAQLWLLPIPTVKVSLGKSGAYSYTEPMDWWKAPTASKLSSAGFSNNIATDEGAGLTVEVTSVPSLTLTGAVAPGWGKSVGTGQGSNLKYGGAAKYDIKNFGSVAVGYREDGKDSPKSIHAGFDVSSIPNVYTFLNLVARSDSNTPVGLNGLAFDWFGKLSLQALTVQAHVPVTIRLTGLKGDVNYLSYNFKAAYALPSLKLTPFVQVQQDHLDLSTVNYLAQYNLGTSFDGFDGSSVDASFQYNLAAEGTWSIPFNVKITF